MPLLLFRTMVAADFHGAAPWALWTTYFTAAAVAWIAGHLVITRLFGRDSQAGVVGGVSAAFSNLVLLGIPFMLGVFGQPGFEILSLIVSVHLPTMIVASIMLFELFGRAKGGALHPAAMLATFLRRLVVNPLIVGILAGLAWRATGLPLPDWAARFVDALADIAGPLALFAMGLGLTRFGISGHVAPALVLSFAQADADAGGGVCAGLVARPAAARRQGGGGGGRPAVGRQLLSDRRPVRHRAGARLEPDVDRHRLRGASPRRSG